MIENFPKKCIMCKRTDVELSSYTVGVSKTKGYRHQTTRTKSFSVPVCEECKSLLNKRSYINLLQTCIGLITLIVFVFSIVPLVFKESYFIQLLIGGVVLLIINIILFIIKSTFTNNIKKYVKPTLSGTIYDAIKDPEYKREMANFQKAKVVKDAIDKELGLNVMYCPRCGSQHKKDTDFCLKCGKDLRTHN